MTPPPFRSRRRRLVASLAIVFVAAAASASSAAAAGTPPAQQPRTASPDPVDTGIDDFPLALVISALDPEMSPPGANDWTCQPSAAHPEPVVLVHGTLENAFDNWSALAPLLAERGYCVFAPNLGANDGAILKATGHVPDSAQQLAAYVDAVLAKTGAKQVDLVGHSQGGGVLPRWYLKFDGGADAKDPSRNKVRRLIGISPSNHGTTVLGTAPLLTATRATDLISALVGPAIPEQLIGSRVNDLLDRGGDTMPGVEYTTIVTSLDEVLTPPGRQFLRPGPGATVRNILLQSACPLDLSDHIATAYDANALQFVLNALDPEHASPVTCGLTLPGLG
jgi:triacylglycerol esterase/lipase EstA (alpha/beta hydrolase family)